MKKLFNILIHSKFTKDIAVYTLFAILQKCIPFLLYPLFARIFSEEEMGFYILYQAIYVLALPVFTLSSDVAITVNFYKLEWICFRGYLGTVLEMTLLFFILIFFVFICFYGKLAIWIDFPASWLLVTVFSILPRFIINSVLALLRCQNNVILYGTLASVATVCSNLIGLYLIYNTVLTWQGVVLGVFIGDFLVACICIGVLVYFKSIDFHFVRKYMNDALKIGIPICFHVIGGWLSSFLSRFFITTLIGIAATGSYGIAATFSMVLNLIIDSFNLAFGPYLSQKLVTFNPNDRIDIFKISILYYSLIIVSSIVVIFIGYYFVGIIFGDKYLSTRDFILPLVIASALNGFYKVHVNYLFFSKKTYLIASVTFVLGVCNIGLSYWMVKFAGMTGAAYTSVIISLCSYIAIAFLANKEYPIGWKEKLKKITHCLLKNDFSCFSS